MGQPPLGWVCTDFPVIVIVIIGIIRSRSERGGTRRDADKEERARHRGEKFKVSEPSARVSDQATHSGLAEPPGACCTVQYQSPNGSTTNP